MSKSSAQGQSQEQYAPSDAEHLDTVAEIIDEGTTPFFPEVTAGRLRALAQQLRDKAMSAECRATPTAGYDNFPPGVQDEALDRARRGLLDARKLLAEREIKHRVQTLRMARIIGDLAQQVEEAVGQQETQFTVVFGSNKGISPEDFSDLILVLEGESENGK